MSDEHDRDLSNRAPGRLLGSLREALNAAGREDARGQSTPPPLRPVSNLEASSELDPTAPPNPEPETTLLLRNVSPLPSAAEAARAARGGTPNIPPVDRHVEFDAPPTTRVVRPERERLAPPSDAPARTRLVRGRQPVKRGTFYQDPVVGWLVVVGGPGLGAYRPIFEGNNTIGRSPTQRIPIDFGDDAISSEEQAYIRYDSTDRTFLFVPNLAKTNVVSVNDKRPTSAVPLVAMDVITMGRTQLVFVPFCGPEFDWSELPDISD
jgi:hypothetical protein|nr:MAG: FHA domain-containing protein [Pseudomonadota bacterium]